MKKLKLDNSGVLIKHNTDTRKKIKLQNKTPDQPKLQTITADFVREVKNELVQELASLIMKMGTSVVERVVYSSEVSSDSSSKSAIMTKPITIDDSVFVTEVTVGKIEKGFDELADTTVSKDENVNSAVSKLKSLKKGN
jgi:hypothetical protein